MVDLRAACESTVEVYSPEELSVLGEYSQIVKLDGGGRVIICMEDVINRFHLIKVKGSAVFF